MTMIANSKTVPAKDRGEKPISPPDLRQNLFGMGAFQQKKCGKRYKKCEV